MKSKKKEYNKNPKLCKKCQHILPYEKRGNSFCNSACSASYNTTGRILNDNQKQNIKNGMLLSIKKNPMMKKIDGKDVRIDKGVKKVNYTRIAIRTCKICNNLFIVQRDSSRKTCSREHSILASTNRKYINGSRKTIEFYHPSQGIIILESSWELKIAELLTKFNFQWVRPGPLKWKDEYNKSHLYYPDFYLIDYDVYLDPKNPYCMIKDKIKIKNILFQGYQLICGDISIIESYINEIKLNLKGVL